MAKKKARNQRSVIRTARPAARERTRDKFVVPRAIQAVQRIEDYISKHVPQLAMRRWLFTATRQALEGLRRKEEQR